MLSQIRNGVLQAVGLIALYVAAGIAAGRCHSIKFSVVVAIAFRKILDRLQNFGQRNRLVQ